MLQEKGFYTTEIGMISMNIGGRRWFLFTGLLVFFFIVFIIRFDFKKKKAKIINHYQFMAIQTGQVLRSGSRGQDIFRTSL